MKQKFIDRNFSAKSLEIIAQANKILDEYKRQDLVLTLRQLYYQFVSKDLIANKQSEYKRIGSIINDARLAGLIDWDMMEDRTRTLRTIPRWESPSSIMDAVASQYQEDLWKDQKNRCEVWIEKDALLGVIEGICNELRVDYFACRGSVSQSAQYEAGLRFQRYKRDKQKVTVFHLGDHDPSGIDMTRDNRDRLAMFSRNGVALKRIALNMDQVEQYSPPPNPAKESDSRYEGYAAEYGTESWELDALEPTVISTLIRTNVESLIDPEPWAAAKAQEKLNKETLKGVSANWPQVQEFVAGLDSDEEDEEE